MNYNRTKKTFSYLGEVLAFLFFLSFFNYPYSYLLQNILHVNTNSFVGSIIGQTFKGFFYILFAWFVTSRRRGWCLKDLGFRTYNGFWKDVWYGVVAFGIIVVINSPLDILVIPARAQEFSGMIESWSSSMASIFFPFQILVFLFASMIGGFFTSAWREEILYRGYLQSSAMKELTPTAGIIGAWLIFSVGHYFSRQDWMFSQVLATLVLGFILVLVYHSTRSLIPVMVAHLLYNSITGFPAFYYLISGKIVSYVIEASLVCMMIVVLFCNRNTLRHLWKNTLSLLKDKVLLSILLGMIFAVVGLSKYPLLTYLHNTFAHMEYQFTVLMMSVFFFIGSLILSKK